MAAGQQTADSSALTAISASRDEPALEISSRWRWRIVVRFTPPVRPCRIDDGDAHHGLPATVAWATKPKDKKVQAQGAVYGIEDGRITSAGYITGKAISLPARAFHGLTLQELEFPAAHYLTVDLIKGASETSNGTARRPAN